MLKGISCLMLAGCFLPGVHSVTGNTNKKERQILLEQTSLVLQDASEVIKYNVIEGSGSKSLKEDQLTACFIFSSLQDGC